LLAYFDRENLGWIYLLLQVPVLWTFGIIAGVKLLASRK
jgi:hypothetical protein